MEALALIEAIEQLGNEMLRELEEANQQHRVGGLLERLLKCYRDPVGTAMNFHRIKAAWMER